MPMRGHRCASPERVCGRAAPQPSWLLCGCGTGVTRYYIQNYIRSEWGHIKDEKAVVIPNMVPKYLKQHDTYIMSETRNLCFAGMMTKRKGYDRFINIICGYSGTKKIVGHVFAKLIYSQMDWAKAQCNASIVFHGPVTTSILWPAVRKMKGMLLFMSRHDNQPMVPLEAGFYGIPVMSSPTGGFREIIRNAPKVIMPDVPTMIKTLNTVLEDPDVRFMVPRLNKDPLQALDRWQDTLLLAKRSHRDHVIAEYPIQRHFEVVDAKRWNESDHCVDETYAGYMILYHSDSWIMDANLTATLAAYVDAQPLIHMMDILLLDWKFKNGTMGFSWEPFMYMQFGWKSCLPSVPIVLSEHAYCQWKAWHIRTAGGRILHADHIIPHIGIWVCDHGAFLTLLVLAVPLCFCAHCPVAGAPHHETDPAGLTPHAGRFVAAPQATNHNMRTKRVHKPWFTLKNNIVDPRDCFWDNVHVVSHALLTWRRLRKRRQTCCHAPLCVCACLPQGSSPHKVSGVLWLIHTGCVPMSVRMGATHVRLMTPAPNTCAGVARRPVVHSHAARVQCHRSNHGQVREQTCRHDVKDYPCKTTKMDRDSA